MAANTPTTGASLRAPSFQDIDLTQLDTVVGHIDVTKTLVDLAIDLCEDGDGQNLLHAATQMLTLASDRLNCTNSDLQAAQRRER